MRDPVPSFASRWLGLVTSRVSTAAWSWVPTRPASGPKLVARPALPGTLVCGDALPFALLVTKKEK